MNGQPFMEVSFFICTRAPRGKCQLELTGARHTSSGEKHSPTRSYRAAACIETRFTGKKLVCKW